MLEGTLTPPRTFLGVHFALFGFDPDTHRKVRTKLINGGGVDDGQYGSNCTHVIVDKIVYDDPLCVAARNDGKTVVNGLWVDHSYDIGMAADTTSVMYRALRDLNGIPGAKNLIICLTGYQRQDREDIMTMVAFMGAHFSKPLVANKVTHLICYKFEGEKYELAKKMKKIKLVNHKWLEDCLRDWEILPEAYYDKSSYELEMEAEAKDSEDEDQPVDQSRGKVINRSPSNMRVGTISPSVLLKPPKEPADISAAQELPNMVGAMDLKTTPIRETRELPVRGSDMGTFKDATSADPHVECEMTPVSEKVIEKHSPRSCETFHLDGKSNSVIYSGKGTRRTSLSIHNNGDKSQRINCSSEVDGGINKPCFIAEQAREGTSFATIQNPSPISDVQKSGSTSAVQQKRKLEASPGTSKSPKTRSHSTPCVSGPFLASNRNEGSEACNPLDQLLMADSSNPEKAGVSVKELNKHDALEKATPYASSSKFLNSNETSPGSLPTSIGLVTSKGNNSYKEALYTSSGPGQGPSGNRHGLGENDMGEPENEFGEIGKEQNLQQAPENLSGRNQDQEYIGESFKMGNFDLLDKESDKVTANLPRKMVTTRKTLGSRSKLCKSTNLKGSIFLSKEDSRDKGLSSMKDREDIGVSDSYLNFVNVAEGSLPPAGNNEVVELMNDEKTVAENLDDETQAPDDKEDCVSEKEVDNENPKSINPAEKAGAAVEETCLQNVMNNTVLNEHGDVRTPKESSSYCGLKVIGGGTSEVGKIGREGISSKGTKLLGKKNKKIVSDAKKIVEDPGNVASDPTSGHTQKGAQKRLSGNGKAKKSVVKAKKLESNTEAEKENKPVRNKVGGETKGTVQARKASVKSDRQVKKVDAGKMKTKSKLTGTQNGGSKEPVWFIFSGLRPLRKKYRQIVRNLKGRFCRDSHHWSYQATHFIASDPLRRTEKFFAAVASGRWILKPDYLTASSEAGKFLDEEPYEWHKNGLSQDGAINLEAPRKWRLLAEKTGHGAFHDMRIIVYGDCITPPLDTLKRVVKAGGGTILATSPPYSRFLSSGVDFAVVSPGMPRVDIWVQEFLKHEIPCVAADYLVEYVCKVGYPLEKHVLYNTHPWAEKSFARLQKKAQEIIEPSSPNIPDLECQVCGSTDRGEVMLICGDESGSNGCGIGYHIDCLNPPMEAVPEEDWFCPKCSSESSDKSNAIPCAAEKKQRGSSLSKRKR